MDKKVNASNIENKMKAVEAHAGFINYVVGKVNKVGIETVLQQYQTPFEATEFFWLKKAYERLLDFAEAIQIKQTVDPSPANSQPIVVVIEKTEANENQLQAPRFAVPNIQ